MPQRHQNAGAAAAEENICNDSLYLPALWGGKMWLVPAGGCGVTPGCLADGDGEKEGDVLLHCGPIQVRTDPPPRHQAERLALTLNQKSP